MANNQGAAHRGTENPTCDHAHQGRGAGGHSQHRLSAWVPTETVAIYVGVQAGLPSARAEERGGHLHADFTDRWVLFVSLLLVTLILVPTFTLRSQVLRGSATDAGETEFKWPVLEMGLTGAAFTLWVFSLPELPPFDTYCDVKEWHSTLALSVGGLLLGAWRWRSSASRPSPRQRRTTRRPPPTCRSACAMSKRGAVRRWGVGALGLSSSVGVLSLGESEPFGYGLSE